MYNIICSGRAINLKLGVDKIICVRRALNKTIYPTNLSKYSKRIYMVCT